MARYIAKRTHFAFGVYRARGAEFESGHKPDPDDAEPVKVKKAPAKNAKAKDSTKDGGDDK